MIKKEVWDKLHKESEGRYHKVTDFARLVYFNFMKGKKGKVLDLCCGKGADAVFFHNKGYNVIALDFSNEAIKQFNEAQKRYDIFVTSMVKDVSEPLGYEDGSFEFIYTRLGLHYFTDKELKKVFKEMTRVLKNDGLLMFQVKSVNDADYGKGKEIEKDMYEDEENHVRHFFSKEYAEKWLDEFDYNIIMLEERQIPSGSAYIEVVAEKR
ncbi:MAG: class I SAM-dependent methyltransferase [Candidatus Woesearchaeota archaeon]|nr:class I SAM-dependent methyltransferase [Candidatus Woesearchaeota archaeon]